MKNLTLFLAALFLCGAVRGAGPAAGANNTHEATPAKYVYKQTDSTSLCIYVYRPGGGQPGGNGKTAANTNANTGSNAGTSSGATPAIVFFFGGGWISGTPSQFVHQAEYFAARGMTAILVDYRTFDSAGTPPTISVADAKSTMRYIRGHAAELGIDSKRIVAAGGSAGGHLAAACAYITSFDDPHDDTKVSSAPDALVLLNPVIDNSENGYGYDRVQAYWRDFSPMHNITPANIRPTIFMVGDRDRLIPVATAEEYQRICTEAGGRCDLKIYPGGEHGFFNYDNRKPTGPDFYSLTLQDADDFLVSLGYIAAP